MDDQPNTDEAAATPATPGCDRLVKIELDEIETPRRSAEAEHERAIAIYDILEQNKFALAGAGGPYHLYLRAEGRHIRFDVRDQLDAELGQFYGDGTVTQGDA